MKKIFVFGALAVAVLAFTGYNVSAQNKQNTREAVPMNINAGKILVAYYSYSGNTKAVAEAIHKQTGGDLFEIKTEGGYPAEYRPMTAQAKREISAGYRPKLTATVENMAQYDVVFIGSPNWWGTITPQVSSFLDSYDLSGKTVVPFITHGGGGFQNTVSDMRAQCKKCNVLANGWAGYGDTTSGLSDWLEKLGFKK